MPKNANIFTIILFTSIKQLGTTSNQPVGVSECVCVWDVFRLEAVLLQPGCFIKHEDKC